MSIFDTGRYGWESKGDIRLISIFRCESLSLMISLLSHGAYAINIEGDLGEGNRGHHGQNKREDIQRKRRWA